MAKLKLTYFDFNGGRGEVARLALSIAKVPFEDHRITQAKFGEMKPELPFGQVPVLHVDGEVVTQSLAINRYVGKLTGLYPDSELKALYCDEVMCAVEDASAKIGFTLGISDPVQLQEARQKLRQGPIRTTLKGLEAILLRRGPEYFCGGECTVADLCAFVWIKWLKSGALDYIPTDTVDEFAPALATHYQRIKSWEPIAHYYRAREFKLPD